MAAEQIQSSEIRKVTGESCLWFLSYVCKHKIVLLTSLSLVIPKVTKHLLSNPVFTCIILAACMEIAVVAGFAAFLGKYLEQQFNLTTTSANQLLGLYSELKCTHMHGHIHRFYGIIIKLALVYFHFKVWQPFHVHVWGSSWGVCWWRSWTCRRWELSAWPCWSTWFPLPAMSPFFSWAVTRVLLQEWQSHTATSKNKALIYVYKPLNIG